MFITGTYNLVARPEWKNIQTEIVYLECDTSLAPVTINLFPIVDLKRFWNVKINIVDKAQNCSVNNITINAGFSGTPPIQDIIDQSGHTQIVLSKNGESILITPVSENQWLANESITVPYAVQSVTGLNTDNTDPINPVVKISVDSATVTGLGTPLSPLESNLVVGTTQIISGTSGAVLFDNGTTVTESTNFVYDDGLIVLSLGGSTSSAKGMLNIKAKDTLATTYSIAVRKNDDSGYLFQVQNDGKLRINDNYTLPNSDGTAGQVLVTDGSGTVTFQSKQDPITLTTTGNSGASTLIGATLNIPEYTLAGLGGVPLGRSININGTTQDLSANRTFTVSDANLSMSDITTNNVSITQHGFAPKAPNDVTKYLDGTGNWSVPSSYGVCGIADNTGKYTYYASLTLAMASAVAGQTIEVFADITETSAVTITLKNGVNINGNGHTYLLNISDTTPAFVTPNSVSGYDIKITNFIIKRTNSTSANGACILIGSNCEGKITFSSTSLINTGLGAGISYVSFNGNVQIINAEVFTNSGNGIHVNSNSINTKIVNCYSYSVSGVAIFAQAFCDIIDCIGESNSGTGIAIASQNCTNSYGRSNSGAGLYSSGGVFWGCTGISNSNYGGYGVNAGYFYNCVLYSSGNIGLYLYNAESFSVKGCNVFSGSNVAVYFNGAISSHKIDIHDTVATSNANFAFSAGIGSMVLYNCSGETLATSCVSAKNSIYGGVYRSKWNNSAGHAITISTVSQLDIVNTTTIVANASANTIYSASATTVNYANNSFKGSTTPVNANITQGIVNTQDNQGNILI